MSGRDKAKQILVQLHGRMKNFLFSEKSREFFIFLFFFVVAAGFWLLQTLNSDYETELSVPVRLKNVPDNVVITSEPASELRVRIKDKGTVLLNYMLGKSFYPVTLDFTDYRSKGNPVRVMSPQFRHMIQAQLNASTSLLSVKPDTLEYIYSEGISKLVPVRLSGEVSAAMQYYLSDTVFTPDSVLVYAPAAALDTLTEVRTRPLSLTEIDDTLRQTVPLESQKGVKTVPSSVELMLPVDIYTEKTVEVPLIGIHFPPGKVLRAFPSKVQVTFQVGLSRFRQIEAEDFQVLVNYEELEALGTDTYTVRLHTQPKGISNVRIYPAQVDFLIEQTSANGY